MRVLICPNLVRRCAFRRKPTNRHGVPNLAKAFPAVDVGVAIASLTASAMRKYYPMAYQRLSYGALTLVLLSTVGCSPKSRAYDEGSAGNGGSDASEGGRTANGGSSATGGKTERASTSTKGGSQSKGGESSTATATGGVDAKGGSTATGGVDAKGGSTATGGTVASAGASSTGGAAAGGTKSTGGSTSAGGCNVIADCANPDPYTCTASCSANTCKLVVSSPLAEAVSTFSSTSNPSDGFWDADNVPYVVYAPYKESASEATLIIQKVKTDGTNNGGGIKLSLPADLAQPTELVAAMNGTQLGLLFGAVQTTSTSGSYNTTQFLRTDVTASPSTPIIVATSTTNGPTSYYAYSLFLSANGAGKWTMAHFAGTGSTRWAGVSGTVSAATTFEFMNPTPYDGYGAMVLLNDTVMVSGLSCTNYRTGTCSAPDLQVMRYLASDLSVTGTATVLGTVPYMNGGGATPAMAKLGNKLAILWTNQSVTGPAELVSAILNKDGTFAKATTKTVSSLIPKAVIEAPDGGMLLVALRADAIGTRTPVVQKLDASLAFVGSSYAIASAMNTDTMRDVAMKNSTDGRTLITFRVGGAPYRRIVHTNLCR